MIESLLERHKTSKTALEEWPSLECQVAIVALTPMLADRHVRFF
jgi:hypothetical protein